MIRHWEKCHQPGNRVTEYTTNIFSIKLTMFVNGVPSFERSDFFFYLWL